MLPEVDQLIRHYNLQPHMQGGYFKQTYRSPLLHNKPTSDKTSIPSSQQQQQQKQKRNLMTVIYYLLRKQQPYAVWHSNKSDIMHFHLRGGSLVYDLISPQGVHERLVLGQDFKNGEILSFLCKAGYHKATTLLNGDFGMLGEAVAPGFQYEDETTFTQEEMVKKFPQLKEAILRNQLNIQNNRRLKQLKQ